MSEIVVCIDKNGQLYGLFVSPDLEDADVELIDLCTDDPDRLNNEENRLIDVGGKMARGELVQI